MLNLKVFFRTNHSIFVISLFIIFISSKTWSYDLQTGDIDLGLGPLLSQTDFKTNDSNYKTSPFAGFGFTLNGHLNSKGLLEISIFHLNKLFYTSKDEFKLIERSKILDIQFGYRYPFISKFSVGLSFSSSYTFGRPQIVKSNYPEDIRPNTSARDVLDFGISPSLRYDFYKSENINSFVDTRYVYSLSTKDNEKANHYQILIGLSFKVDKKNPSSTPL